ncbi:hypothetical protein OH77DRAFT_579812 [Trametes cingulata]|nr:hypothetical protein OH77DRAFT_579812 [Trametes cingulata]
MSMIISSTTTRNGGSESALLRIGNSTLGSPIGRRRVVGASCRTDKCLRYNRTRARAVGVAYNVHIRLTVPRRARETQIAKRETRNTPAAVLRVRTCILELFAFAFVPWALVYP